MTNPDEKLAAFKWRLNRRLHKPIGHHEAHAQEGPTSVEFHAPDPETHGQGAQAIESEKPEMGRICPSCQSPAHAHDQKCPWCGADLSPA